MKKQLYAFMCSSALLTLAGCGCEKKEVATEQEVTAPSQEEVMTSADVTAVPVAAAEQQPAELNKF